MKKLFSEKMAVLVIVMLIMFAMFAPVAAQAQYPFNKALTLPGGTNGNVITWSYTNGVNRDAYSAFCLDTIEVMPSATLTNAFTVTPTRSRSSGSSNAVYGAITVASNTSYGISYVSNTVWNFRTDTLIFTANFTNAGTIWLSGKEQ